MPHLVALQPMPTGPSESDYRSTRPGDRARSRSGSELGQSRGVGDRRGVRLSNSERLHRQFFEGTCPAAEFGGGGRSGHAALAVGRGVARIRSLELVTEVGPGRQQLHDFVARQRH